MVFIFFYFYTLYYSTATSVSLKDVSFDEEDFEILHGLLHVNWDKIPAYPLLCLYDIFSYYIVTFS